MVGLTAVVSKLPGRSRSTSELGECGRNAGIHRSVRGREIFPGIDLVAPIVEAPGGVQPVERSELLAHPRCEGCLHVRTARLVRLRFIVGLTGDHCRMIADMSVHRPDRISGNAPEVSVGDVHILAGAKRAQTIRRSRQNIRVLPGHPRIAPVHDAPLACGVSRGRIEQAASLIRSAAATCNASTRIGSSALASPSCARRSFSSLVGDGRWVVSASSTRSTAHRMPVNV